MATGFDIPQFGRKAEAPLLKAAASVTPAPLTVETFYNHVYFYSDVDPDRCLALMRSLREVDAQLRHERLTRDLPAEFPQVPIWLHIQSGGGDLMAALAIADQLPMIQSPIYSVVEGLGASAATLISMACERRFIQPMSFMLIHQLRSVAWGTHQEIKDEMILLDGLMDHLVEFYVRKTKLTADQVREHLKHDSWFSAEQSLEAGLVDEIYGAVG